MASSSQIDVGALFQSYIDCLDQRRWDDCTNYIHGRLSRNGQDHALDEYLAQVRRAIDSMPDASLKIDALVVDKSAQSIGARITIRGTPAAPSNDASTSGRPPGLTEHVIAWFEGGKIKKITSMEDTDALRTQPANSLASTAKQPQQPKERDDLAATYRAYIGCINAKTMAAELPLYVEPRVTHNGRLFTIDEYRQMIADSFDAIRDLHFGISALVVDQETQQLMARLRFNGTPIQPLYGIPGTEPNGKDVEFHEHVIYSFVDGKIDTVWSLLEMDVYRKQMSG